MTTNEVTQIYRTGFRPSKSHIVCSTTTIFWEHNLIHHMAAWKLNRSWQYESRQSRVFVLFFGESEVFLTSLLVFFCFFVSWMLSDGFALFLILYLSLNFFFSENDADWCTFQTAIRSSHSLTLFWSAKLPIFFTKVFFPIILGFHFFKRSTRSKFFLRLHEKTSGKRIRWPWSGSAQS